MIYFLKKIFYKLFNRYAFYKINPINANNNHSNILYICLLNEVNILNRSVYHYFDNDNSEYVYYYYITNEWKGNLSEQDKSNIESILQKESISKIQVLHSYYEDPHSWQSNVDIIGGDILLLKNIKYDNLKLYTLIENDLNKYHVNFKNEEDKKDIQTLSYLSTLGVKELNYSECLIKITHIKDINQWINKIHNIKNIGKKEGLKMHYNLPLVSMGNSFYKYVMIYILLYPFVLFSFILNFPVVLLNNIKEPKSVDNLFKMTSPIYGFLSMFIWIPFILFIGCTFFHPIFIFFYFSISCIGFNYLYRFKKLRIATYNFYRASDTLKLKLNLLHHHMVNMLNKMR